MTNKNSGEVPPSEFAVFTSTIDRLLSVSKIDIEEREDAYRDEVDRNPRKRGPKRKRRRG